MIKQILAGGFVLLLAGLLSCDDDDTVPGYYSVDGKKYQLEYATIHPDGYNTGPFETEVVMTHARGHQVWVIFITPEQEVRTGTYTFTADRDELNSINYCDVSIGIDIPHVTSSGTTAEGTFRVSVKGDIYTFDLDAVIDGHVVKARYKGDVHVFSPT